MQMLTLGSLFHIDILTQIMMTLVGFIGVIVWFFAKRYMEGDSHYYRFQIYLLLLLCSIMVMVSADNLFLFLGAWGLSNGLLVKLMVHKDSWKAAKQSGTLATKVFMISSLSLMSGFFMLYWATGQTSIQSIIQASLADHILIDMSLIAILIGAMSQSAIWPFHRWLLSSLNSPTPVSALMHAGLINGGGFLMIRFAPIYLAEPELLSLLFSAGLCTALIGTLWKLMQNDYKRMLACSTMAQMGFMMVQCGLGLFSAAVAHLCWHGMFKAYLFLSSGGAAQEKRLSKQVKIKTDVLLLSLLCGVLGAYVFTLTSGKPWLTFDTNTVLIGIAFIASTQFALTLLYIKSWRNLVPALIMTAVGAASYGWSVGLMHDLLSPLNIDLAQHLNILHVLGLIIFGSAWLILNVGNSWIGLLGSSDVLKYFYVKVLNASQPHPSSVTTHHNHYNY